MTTQKYPIFDTAIMSDIMREIIRLREEDIGDFTNLPNVLIRGRKVDKIPSASNDVVAGVDRVDDVNWSPSYLYILVDNSGTATWRRVALASW